MPRLGVQCQIRAETVLVRVARVLSNWGLLPRRPVSRICTLVLSLEGNKESVYVSLLSDVFELKTLEGSESTRGVTVAKDYFRKMHTAKGAATHEQPQNSNVTKS